MNAVDKIVCIDEATKHNGLDDPSACAETVSYTKKHVTNDKNACMYCANYADNAERAWSVMSSFVQQLSQIQSLENENQQLSRINEEQQVYMANQRQRYQSVDEEILKSGSKIRELEDRLQCVNSQYWDILNKAAEAQEAANTWRRKYDMSQELIVELERKTAENHRLHISSLAVAASFSKSHDAIEARNVSLVAKVAELERQNQDLHRKVNDLECRTRLLEERQSKHRDRACSPILPPPPPSAAAVDVEMPPPASSLRARPKIVTQLLAAASCVERAPCKRRSSAAIAEIFQCSFLMEFSAQTIMDPYEIDFDSLTQLPSIPNTEHAQRTGDAKEQCPTTSGASQAVGLDAPKTDDVKERDGRTDTMNTVEMAGGGDAKEVSTLVDNDVPKSASLVASPVKDLARTSVLSSIGMEMEDDDYDHPLEIAEDCGSSVDDSVC